MKKILIFVSFITLLLQSSVSFAEAKYTFYHILWSMTDVNVQFHLKGGDAYMKSHPDVEIKYVSGDIKRIKMLSRIDTKNELEYYKNGGILQYVLRNMI